MINRDKFYCTAFLLIAGFSVVFWGLAVWKGDETLRLAHQGVGMGAFALARTFRGRS